MSENKDALYYFKEYALRSATSVAILDLEFNVIFTNKQFEENMPAIREGFNVKELFFDKNIELIIEKILEKDTIVLDGFTSLVSCSNISLAPIVDSDFDIVQYISMTLNMNNETSLNYANQNMDFNEKFQRKITTLINNTIMRTEFISYFLEENEHYDMLEESNIIAKNMYLFKRNLTNLNYYSKLSNGVPCIRLENKVINSFIEEVCLTSKAIICRNNINFEYELEKRLLFIEFDPDALGVAIGNILSNSCKSMSGREDQENKIKITTKLNGNNYYIKITDNGAGIEDVNLADIFDAANMSKNNSDDMYRGLGIGLITTKNIIYAHNGNIFFDKNDDGFSLIITLPISKQIEDIREFRQKNLFNNTEHTQCYIQLADFLKI